MDEKNIYTGLPEEDTDVTEDVEEDTESEVA